MMELYKPAFKISRTVLFLSVSFTVALSVISIAGWIGQQMYLASIGEGYIPMAPLTAISFLLISAGILIRYYLPNHKYWIIACGILVILAVFDIFLSAIGIPLLNVEQIMVDNPGLFGAVPVGRMSPITAFLFLMCSVVLIALEWSNETSKKVVGIFTAVAFTITIVLLVGYLYNSPILYGQTIIPVALSTTICFFFTILAVLAMHDKESFPLNYFFGKSTHVRLLRVFLPLTAFMIIAGGAFQIYLRQNYIINEALVISLIALISVILVAAVAMLTAKMISRQFRKTEAEKNRMVDIIGATSDLVGIYNREGRPTYLNRQFRKINNIPGDADLTDYHISQFYSEKDARILMKKTIPYAAENGEWKGELNILAENGKSIPVSQVILYHAEKNGQEDWYSIIARDISNFKKAQKEIEEFAYVASHDLKEPLRMVNNFTGLLERKYGDQLDAKASSYIRCAQDGTKRMQKLIDDLLDYSRLTHSKSKTECVDVNEVLANVRDVLCKTAIEETAADVHWEKMPVIKAAYTPVQQLFQNLISNGLKYHAADRKPEIEIKAEELPRHWKFSVSDNGIGIEKENQEEIFKVFKRLHTRDEYSGSGMGLAMCKKITEQYGGKIWVDSKPGKGSTFYFTIAKNSDDNEKV